MTGCDRGEGGLEQNYVTLDCGENLKFLKFFANFRFLSTIFTCEKRSNVYFEVHLGVSYGANTVLSTTFFKNPAKKLGF